MAISREHIHIDSVAPETTPSHDGPSSYVTVTFRVLEPHHPNSFLVPVSVNLDQFDDEEVERHARYVFHHFMRTLADETRAWDALGQPAVRV